WCLRWLIQESRSTVLATVLRENLVRFDELPITARVASVPDLPPDTTVELEVSSIDLLELTLHCEFRRKIDGDS
ncbi:MAG TPA: RNB domain-containing ribonuclease, partial [Burkholderiales bacterium]|nr:RNB domain-containing ribonuclease [Burkholderiales bacterium]